MALLSVWGIVLVVLGHSGFEEPIVAERLSGLHGWIYGFHMPLFFFISGYLFAYTNPDFAKIDAASFLWKKVRRLIVPYVVLGVILFVVKCAFSSLSHADREFSALSFFRMFVAPGAANSTMGYLWYVFTLFVIFAAVVGLASFGVDLKKPGHALALIFSSWALKLLLPEICLLNLSAVLWYLPFFVLGIGFHTYETRFFHPKSRILRGGGNVDALSADASRNCRNRKFFHPSDRRCRWNRVFRFDLPSAACVVRKRPTGAAFRQNIRRLSAFLVLAVCCEGRGARYAASALDDLRGGYVRSRNNRTAVGLPNRESIAGLEE